MDFASRNGIESNQEYSELREQIEIYTCKECLDEYLQGWSENFCTDGCEAEYIQKWG